MNTEPKMTPPAVPIDTLPRIDFVEMNTARWGGISDIPLLREPTKKNIITKLVEMGNLINDINARSIARADARFHKKMPDGYYIQDDCWNIIKGFLLKPDWKPRKKPFPFDYRNIKFKKNNMYALNYNQVMLCTKVTNCFVTFRLMKLWIEKDNEGKKCWLITTNPPDVGGVIDIRVKKNPLRQQELAKYVEDKDAFCGFKQVLYVKKNMESVTIDKTLNGVNYAGTITAHTDLLVNNQNYNNYWKPEYFEGFAELRSWNRCFRVCWGTKWRENGNVGVTTTNGITNT